MSMSVNIHATGRYERVIFKAEGLSSSATGDLMLDVNTYYDNAQTADVTLFLSPTTARELVACVAGFLGLRVDELAENCPECGIKLSGVTTSWQQPTIAEEQADLAERPKDLP